MGKSGGSSQNFGFQRFSGYWVSDLVKVDLLVAGEPVDALSFICHREHAFPRGRVLCDKMRKLIPRQMFEVATPLLVPIHNDWLLITDCEMLLLGGIREVCPVTCESE